ncbi:MAG: LacI family DNA-binding transcriptional regulator [Spirochaetaceae bacterium]|jgi:LacI family transcriptional regulator|nr:LacI family DNA-binding transcriptional regulator [Spirochaetaceae bacterium]
MTKRVTVYDIAEKLKISPSTVSRVLNNSSLISNHRSQQILKTAQEMGYKQRNIKKQVTRAILNIHLFLPLSDTSLTHYLYNIAELIDSIHEGFKGVRLNISIRNNDGNMEFLSYKKTGQIDGCIFAFIKPNRILSAELKIREIPVVLLNRKSSHFSCIYYDTNQGMQVLAEKVYERWGKKIRPCFVGFQGLKSLSIERLKGAQQVFQSHGIPFNEDHLFIVDDLENISTSVPPWIIKNGFNAVLSFNDLVALSLLQSLLSRGIRIPEDLALTGFDNSPILKLLDRRINTIDLSIPELGHRAGEWLHSTIMEKKDHPLREILPVIYVPGDTI